MIRFLIIMALSVFALTGCINSSRYHGAYGSNSYMKNAQTIPPIRVPPDIPSPAADPLYPIPWTVQGKANPRLSLIPPDSGYHRYLAEEKQSNKKKASKKLLQQVNS